LENKSVQNASLYKVTSKAALDLILWVHTFR